MAKVVTVRYRAPERAPHALQIGDAQTDRHVDVRDNSMLSDLPLIIKHAITRDGASVAVKTAGYKICIAPDGLSAGDMAVSVSQVLLAQIPSEQTSTIGAVIYCHCSIDEGGSPSTVGRLQHELGLNNAFPFAVSQQHCCSVFSALKIAVSLIEGSEAMTSVLIVASDRWPQFLSRDFGDTPCFGDGAAALLVGGDAFDGLRISHVGLGSRSVEFASASTAPLRQQELAAFAARSISEAIQTCNVEPHLIDLVIPQNFSATFVSAVMQQSVLARADVYRDSAQAHGHLSSADTMANLAGVLASVGLESRKRLFAWGVGQNGEFGCCVLERQ